MKFGLRYASLGRYADGDAAVALAQAAEAAGFDSIWTIDHVIAPRRDTVQFGLVYDPLIVLALAAALTERVMLGVSVLVLPYRHGVLTAKMIASLDDLSAGRVILGVGAGWNATESAILGLPFEQRGPMTDEWLRVMRELWTNPDPRLEGAFTRFADVDFRPAPVQKPHPPIWVGGHSPAALRRTAEFGDAWHPINRTLDELQAGLVALERLCERFGRDRPPLLAPRWDARLVVDGGGFPASTHSGQPIEGTPEQLAEQIEALGRLGAEHVVLEFLGRDVEHYMTQLEVFAREVLPRFAATSPA
jgi:probable F420-dependent oxidoreductase